MRSDHQLPRDFSIFILVAFGLILFTRISPLSAEPVQQAQDLSAEESEVIANLEFFETLEFLEEEIVLSDDYEVLDEWEVSGNEH